MADKFCGTPAQQEQAICLFHDIGCGMPVEGDKSAAFSGELAACAGTFTQIIRQNTDLYNTPGAGWIAFFTTHPVVVGETAALETPSSGSGVCTLTALALGGYFSIYFDPGHPFYGTYSRGDPPQYEAPINPLPPPNVRIGPEGQLTPLTG